MTAPGRVTEEEVERTISTICQCVDHLSVRNSAAISGLFGWARALLAERAALEAKLATARREAFREALEKWNRCAMFYTGTHSGPEAFGPWLEAQAEGGGA